jgi:hypothetical protein
MGFDPDLSVMMLTILASNYILGYDIDFRGWAPMALGVASTALCYIGVD